MESRASRASRVFHASPRQRQILLLAAEGRTDKEIARTLALSVATIRTHLGRLYRDNGLRNRAEAASAWVVARSESKPPSEGVAST